MHGYHPICNSITCDVPDMVISQPIQELASAAGTKNEPTESTCKWGRVFPNMQANDGLVLCATRPLSTI